MSTENAPDLSALTKAVGDIGGKLDGFATRKEMEPLQKSINDLTAAVGEISVRDRQAANKETVGGILDLFPQDGCLLQTIVKAQLGDDDAKAKIFGPKGYVKLADEYMKTVHKAPTGYSTLGAEAEIFIVPEVSQAIFRVETERVDMRSFARVIPMTSNLWRQPYLDNFNQRTGTETGKINPTHLGEGNETSRSSKTEFGFLELKPSKISDGMYVTEEMLEDGPALQSYVSALFPEQIAFKEESHFFTGTGVGEPLGALHASNPARIAVDRDTNDDLKVADLLAMMARRYTTKGGNWFWRYSIDILPKLAALAIGNSPVWTTDLRNGIGIERIMGIPAIQTHAAPTLGDLGDLALIDGSQYLIGDRGGLKTQQSMHVRFWQGEMALRWVKRYDGQPGWKSVFTPKGTDRATLSPFVVLDA